MSAPVIERLIEAQDSLIEALDGDEPQPIEAAIAEFRNALDLIKVLGEWHATPETVAQLTRALALADTARARVNFLTDRTHRRLDLLARATGADRPPPSYGRDGRMRAA